MIVNSHRFGGGVPAALGHYSIDDGDYLGMALPAFPIPHTFAIWVKAPGTTLVANFVKAYNSSTPGNSVYAVYCSTNQVKYLVVDTTGASSSAIDTDLFPANTWFLAIGRAATSSTRYALLNAATEGSNTFVRNIAGINTLRIGNAAGESANGPVKLAHAALWDKELSAGEMTQLLTKIPSSVAAGNLLHYIPLNDGTAVDTVTTTTLTPTATPTADTTDGPSLVS